ncbi:MAG: HAMP domain-containing protein, partial [Anaerolineae bacterium]|nr:HAMP domain-containing protein [Anaerolineae bacterium]
MFAQRGLSSRLNVIVISINFIVLMIVLILANLSTSSALRNQAIERFSVKNTETTAELDALFSTFIDNVENLSAAMSDVEDLEDASLIRAQLLAQLEAMDNQALISRISIVRPDQSVGVLFFENPINQANYVWRVFRQVRDLPTNTIIRQSYETGEALWFQQARPYNDDLEQPVLSFVYPYSHEQGDSVLWVDIPLSILHGIVTNALNNRGLLTETEHGYVILVDQNNIPLSLHNVPQVSDISRTIRSLFDAHTEEHRHESGLFSHADPFNNGNTGLFAINHLDSTGWSIVDVLPENEIPVLPNTVLVPIILVAATGLIILLIAVNRFIDRSVVQPLVDLGRSATEIGEGNMRYVVFHQDKKDEIGNLSNAMDSMRSRLKDSYDELHSWSRTLEERVDERTKQLAIAQKRAEENAIQLRAVYDESLSVVNETQLRPVLDAFIERVLTLFEATYCAIWLLTPEKQHLQLVATNDVYRGKGMGHKLLILMKASLDKLSSRA